MLNNAFSGNNSSSCTSEVFKSLDNIDEDSLKLKKSNGFVQLIEHLSKTNFDDDRNLQKASEMINDTELTSSQWKKIASILIDGLILNKVKSNSSEPNEVKDLPNKNYVSLSIGNNIKPKITANQKPLIRRKVFNDSDLNFSIENDAKNKKHKGGCLWGKGAEQLVPFEIGMKILDDNIDFSDQMIGEETKQKIMKIENDACRMAYKRMNDNPDYQRLFNEKEHWKYLAKTRLIELENEIDFRYQLVFGDEKKKFL